MISSVDFGRKDIALYAGGRERAIGYGELAQWVSADRGLLRQVGRPALAFMFCPNSAGAVAAYLACLAEGMPLGLGEPSAELRSRVVEVYRPNALILPKSEAIPEGYAAVGDLADGELVLCHSAAAAYAVEPHRDLALLLATSGSTGDAKFVRLSLINLEVNARSIARYLGLVPGEIAIQSLPMHYSYGLSVLNSHLVSGGALALSGHSFMRPEFWQAADDCGCTSFAGVPYMYETLRRLGQSPTDRPAIRTLTQAGGHLRVDLARQIHDAAAKKGARFFVMYGQTEATARISYVPPERLAEKAGSIGIPVPGGELWLEAAESEPKMRQLFYRGKNVMLGYATTPADLSLGDQLGSVLPTGDLAECDSDGYFRITGRLARFAKLFGKRVNLSSVETEVERLFFVRTAAVDGGDLLKVFLEGGSGADGGAVRSHLAGLIGVPPLSVKIEVVGQLPMTAAGKKDYKALR